MTRLLFLGGNGHCAARLARAREAAGRLGVLIEDIPYPGFEGRPRAASLDVFLEAVRAVAGEAPLIYATGIGGLLALSLRARGVWRQQRLLLQAPVLWGLERRTMPRLMRMGPLRGLATHLFASSLFRAGFSHRYFRRVLTPDERAAFFDGYTQCAALPDFFEWLTPAWLRQLESHFAAHPEGLADIDVWWGGRDRVVTLDELHWTEEALRIRWPLRVFPEWGHYPMIDDPEAWAAAVSEAVRPATTPPSTWAR